MKKKIIIRFDHIEDKKYNVGSEEPSYPITYLGKSFHFFLFNENKTLKPINSIFDLLNIVKYDYALINGDENINLIKEVVS